MPDFFIKQENHRFIVPIYLAFLLFTSLASLAVAEVCWWKMSMISVSSSDMRISMVWSGSLVIEGREKSFMVYMYQQSLFRLPMQYAEDRTEYNAR